MIKKIVDSNEVEQQVILQALSGLVLVQIKVVVFLLLKIINTENFKINCVLDILLPANVCRQAVLHVFLNLMEKKTESKKVFEKKEVWYENQKNRVNDHSKESNVSDKIHFFHTEILGKSFWKVFFKSLRWILRDFIIILSI